jgi:hypothetical protein
MKKIVPLILASGISLVALAGVAQAATDPTSVIPEVGFPPAIAELDQWVALHPLNSKDAAQLIKQQHDQSPAAHRKGNTAQAERLVEFVQEIPQ